MTVPTEPQNLQRLTTEYDEREDRVRLSGELEGGPPVVIWLTRRLLERLLPVLLHRLAARCATTPHAEVLLGFAQQAASAELAPQAPVRAAARSPAWLVLSIDIAQSELAVGLVFQGGDGRSAALLLNDKSLRQWLSIVHGAYLKAEWPLDAWPAWLRENAPSDRLGHVVLH